MSQAQKVDLETSLRLYSDLFMCRQAEQFIMDHYHEDEMMTPMHMSMGQEAAPVAICNAFDRKCDIFSSYRSHAPFLAQTQDIEKFLTEMYGRIGGTADGKSGSLHLSYPEKGHIIASGIVAAMIAPAVGAGFANKRMGIDRVSVVFLGDGALEEGASFESLNIAQLYQVPVLFVCEDNGFAVNSDKSLRHGFPSIEKMIGGFGIQYFEDDSNDVEKIFSICRQIKQHFNQVGGPAFLHIHCTRYLQHVGVGEDWHDGYRDREKHQKWFDSDSLQMQRNRLIGMGYSEKALNELEEKILATVTDAGGKAQKAPKPTRDDLHRGVFYGDN